MSVMHSKASYHDLFQYDMSYIAHHMEVHRFRLDQLNPLIWGGPAHHYCGLLLHSRSTLAMLYIIIITTRVIEMVSVCIYYLTLQFEPNIL